MVDPSAERQPLSPEVRAALHSLGYMGGGGHEEMADAAGHSDLERYPPVGLNPVEHAGEVRALKRCVALVNARQFEPAAEMLRALLEDQRHRERGRFHALRLLGNARGASVGSTRRSSCTARRCASARRTSSRSRTWAAR